MTWKLSRIPHARIPPFHHDRGGSRLCPRPLLEKARLIAAVRKAVWPLIEEGRIKPVIDRTFPLRDASAAHAYMESGQHVGKILLVV